MTSCLLTSPYLEDPLHVSASKILCLLVFWQFNYIVNDISPQKNEGNYDNCLWFSSDERENRGF